MADNDKTIGSGRRRKQDGADVHATGKAGRGTDAHSTAKAPRNTDAHSTAKATRQTDTDTHSTAKATRPASNTDNHSTAKAVRQASSGNADSGPQRFEQKAGDDLRNRLSQKTEASGSVPEWPDEFVLDGKKYKNEGVLSDSSGEAIIFTVSRGGKKFALKIYYYDPDHRPNHTVLEKIRQLGGSGLLVSIVSHGQWSNPANRGEENDYELMDFCEGGSLDGVVLAGDEKTLAEVAVRMGAAIDFLAKHGILHRDIKPANFFYADKARTQIVLADFGISVECPEGGIVKIDEMRSPVYAAPEFYANVPGEPAEVGVESDYYSLGVALLCLWMGKEKLTADENKLLRAKLKEDLPMPDNMSAHAKSLIKALTRIKMNDRATFDDIRRWAGGENLDGSADDADSDFRVVFNSAKNQIARTPAQLAAFLLEDKNLGKKYLYTNRIVRWLEESGKNELAVFVEDIYKKIYPKNEDAGLMAVVYLLDPAADYVAPDGSHFTDPEEIARHIFNNSQDMADEVLEPNSNLMVYLRARKLDKTVRAIRSYVNSDEFVNDDEALNNFKACYYLAVQLCENLPFPVVVNGDDWAWADNVDELIELLGKEGTLGYVNKTMIESQSFIVWLSDQRPELAGKVRMLHDNSNDDPESPYYHSESAYRIIYEIDPRTDLFLKTDPDDPDRVYTIPQVGEYLNYRLNAMTHGHTDAEEFFSLFVYMDNSQLGAYLRSRGEAYRTFLSWNRYCMDCDSEENKQKAGPYDVVIGAYKSVAGFLQKAPYYEIGEIKLNNLDDLKKVAPNDVADSVGGEIRYMPAGEGKPVPWLDAWLTIFFQENPQLDLSKPFTYEKKTAEYVEFIGSIAPNDFYYKRYRKAIRKVDKAAVQLKKSDRSVKVKRNIFLVLGLVPTLIMLIASWFLDFPGGNPISGHFMATWGLCALALWIAMGFALEFGAGFIPGVVGGLVCATFAYCGFRWFPSVMYLICGAVLIIGGIIAVKKLFEREEVDTGGNEIRGDEFEYRQLDALYFAYHQKDDKLDNVVTQYSTLQRQDDKVTRENISFVGGIWIPIVWMLFILWYFATPQLSHSNAWLPEGGIEKVEPNQWVKGRWVTKYASGSTRIVCNIDSVDKDRVIYGTMELAGQAPVAASGSVRSKNDTIPDNFNFKVKGTDFQRQEFSASYDTYSKEMRAYYYDRKGIMHELTILSSPLTDKNKKQTKSSGSSSTKSSSSKSKKVETPAQTASEPAVQESQEQSSGNILPTLPGWEDEPEVAPEPAQPEVVEEPTPEPEPVPDSRATRQKLRTPGN